MRKKADPDPCRQVTALKMVAKESLFLRILPDGTSRRAA